MKADLPKYRLHFDQETMDWWMSFLDNDRQTEEAHPRWILPLLLKAKKDEQPVKQPDVCQAEQELIKLIHKEEKEVEVTVDIGILSKYNDVA